MLTLNESSDIPRSLWPSDPLKTLQQDGLRESVLQILGILKDEIALLGNSTRVFLGGIRKGMATALWSFLCASGRIQWPLGGVVAFCVWLPFAEQPKNLVRRQQAQDFLRQYSGSKVSSGPSGLENQRQLSKLFLDTIAGPNVPQMPEETDMFILSTPVFLRHGADDELGAVRLGRQAARILGQIDVFTEWEELTAPKKMATGSSSPRDSIRLSSSSRNRSTVFHESP